MVYTTQTTILKWIVGSFAILMAFVGFGSAQISISSCDDLASANNNLTTGYILTQDIDCSGSGNSIMIGTEGNPFMGAFDGQGYTITVDINSPETYIGLFRHSSAANISNIVLAGSVISTYNNFMFMNEANVGGLVGYAQASTLTNIRSSAYVEGISPSIGGLVGTTNNSSIINASFHGQVVGSGNNGMDVGGLAGRSQNNSTITNSYTDGEITAEGGVGGLVGSLIDSTINTSYSLSAIYGGSAGGLIGWSFSSNITNSYAMGDITGGGQMGGLIGFVDSTILTNTYAIGSIIALGGTHFGGLVANSQGGANGATASFWDTETSTMATSMLGEGKTTLEMTDIDTFSGWDFDTIWSISGVLNGGYPYLQYQTFTDPAADLMIYMNGNGPISPGSLTHSYSVEYINYGPSTVNDVLITIEGWLYSTGFQMASGFNGSTYSGIVEGSYIQWTDVLTMGDDGEFDFLITHPSDGVYVYTASISSLNIQDLTGDNNTFTVNSTVDTVTQIPTLSSPTSGSTHIRTAQMDISFSLPETASTNSIQLHFIPQDLSGGTISLTLADVVPTIQQNVSLYPEDIMTLPWVTSTNATDIPNGTYTIVLSYQDIFGNPAATSTTTDVIIMDAPEPYILTEVIPISSTITSNSALYIFSSAGTGLADPVVTPCGWSSNVSISENNLNTTVELEITGLEVGKTYQCQIAFKSLGDIHSNRLDIGPFTVVAPSNGGGGGGSSFDYCPYGDTSGSYYDRQCGDEKSLVEKIIAKLTSSWANRSDEKVQGMLATLELLNTKIQAKEGVSATMKQLFHDIVEGLVAHYNK